MSSRSKIVYVISMVDNSLPFFWFFKELKETGNDFDVIFLHPKPPALLARLKDENMACHFLKYSSKLDIPDVLFRLYFLIKKLKPTVVHTHLFDASILGLTAARLTGVKRIVHTRHHATYHHVYFPHAVKYDKFINTLSHSVIATSEMIRDILVRKEGVDLSKVQVVYHGFQLEQYDKVDSIRISDFRERNRIPSGRIYIGIVSRYTEWKGVQYIIPAFRKLYLENPNLHLVLANAHGDYKNEIQGMLSKLPDDAYTEIVFETDTQALFSSFDIFVHCPIDEHSEAFGQVYVEALAAGVPSVFTHSGVSPSFIKDGVNALIADYHSSESIERALKRLLTDRQLAFALSARGQLDVRQLFGITRMVQQTLNCYAVR